MNLTKTVSSMIPCLGFAQVPKYSTFVDATRFAKGWTFTYEKCRLFTKAKPKEFLMGDPRRKHIGTVWFDVLHPEDVYLKHQDYIISDTKDDLKQYL